MGLRRWLKTMLLPPKRQWLVLLRNEMEKCGIRVSRNSRVSTWLGKVLRGYGPAVSRAEEMLGRS